jgi:fibro-slime domain-containing protein
MTFKTHLSFFAWVLMMAGGISCGTGVDEGGDLGESGGTNSGGNGNTGGSGIIGRTGGSSGISVVSAACGDGKWNQGEFCDDGNKTNGDCCNEFCNLEADCVCPDPPMVGACRTLTQCGNGFLTSAEACDDGNHDPGDGCSPDCQMVTPGWQCRVPGKKCVPFCGDGQLIGGENCDDMNAVSGDGCSSTCLTEPGWSCSGTPSACTASVCGNGMMESGEGCDLGAENGLFYGDATGCSKTCTKEPNCRAGGMTQACSTACGDGNVDMADGEVCDDGNAIAGDGCSDTCQLEGGFMCGNMEAPDTIPCPSNPALQCLVLPVVYRDFKGQQEAGGHPDFFFMGATTPAGTPGHVGGKTSCVPNASGTRAPYTAGDACPNTDAVGPCTGIAAATLNAMGKPTLAKDTCPCIFTDWDKTGVLTGTSPTTCWVEGEAAPNTRDRVDAMVKVVKDAASFTQWYSASDQSTESRGFLELAETAGQFQFSSSVPGAPAGAVGRVVTEDIHATCLGTATPLQSGFFPLEESAGSAKICNLWPYWKTGLTTTNCVATAGNPIVAQWDPLAAWDMCPTTGTGGFVPNSGGTGSLAGVPRNFYFTTEARYLFRYTAPAPLTFYGDDDVWVFVNGRLALDLGAPHERLQGTVMIDPSYGLEVGRIYEIAVFHADRHPRESNYQLTLSSFATTKSVCEPRCGDEITTLTEECDDGDAATDTDGILNTDGVYGGCSTECKFGPFCGDGALFDGINPATMQPYEQCDKGRDNVGVYGTIGGCSPSCQLTPACGDGIIDSAFGETCDDGANNGMSGSSCSMACVKIVL